MVVELHQPPGFKAGDEGRLERDSRFESSTPRIWRQPSPLIPIDEDRLRRSSRKRGSIRLVSRRWAKRRSSPSRLLLIRQVLAGTCQFFRHGLDLTGGRPGTHSPRPSRTVETGQTAPRTAPRGRAGPATPACRPASPARGCNSRTDTRCEQPCDTVSISASRTRDSFSRPLVAASPRLRSSALRAAGGHGVTPL